MISLPKTVVNFASGSRRVRFQGEVELSSLLVSYCLWVVVEFFEVVVDGSRSFLLLVTTQKEVNNSGKVTLDWR